jgi:hypothetical protein
MKTPFKKYKEKYLKLNEDLKKEQLKCLHPSEHVTITYRGCDADYYNPTKYWISHTCNYCGKTWMTE